MKGIGKKFRLVILLSVALMLLLAGCGGPKADVSIFIMPKNGFPSDATESLQKSLQAEIGASPTVQFSSSPIYSPEKLLVEVAAGGHGILILSEEDFKSLAQQGANVSLDDMFNPADYPGGVLAIAPEDPNAVPGQTPAPKPAANVPKHLYGVPVSQTKLFKDLGYKGPELYAIIHPRAPHMDQAKQVLKVIMGK